MGEIIKAIYGCEKIPTSEMLSHGDCFAEALRHMPLAEKRILDEQKAILKDCIVKLGEKGACELLGKLGIWMMINDYTSKDGR